MGQNSAKDPAALGPLEAQSIVNLLCDRLGKLRGCVRKQDLTFTTGLLSQNIYGVGFLPQQAVTLTGSGAGTPTTPSAARLAINYASSGLTSYALDSPANSGTLTFPPTFSGPGSGITDGTIGTFTNCRARFAAFGSELYAVQDQNNLNNYRMLANGKWYQMGLPTLAALTVALNTPGGPHNPTGTRTYVFTTVDSLGRESSPSPASSILAFGGGLTDVGKITMPAGFNTTGADVVSANIYATTGNGELYYKIGSTTNKGGGVVLTDDFTDATIQTGASAPAFGQNDPPLPASMICVHKNHVVLNVTADASSIQISNFGSATQFSTLGLLTDINGQVSNPNDGITLQVSTDAGNDVTGLASLGSVLVIGRQRSIWVLFGDSIVDFIPRRIDDRGNVSPDAMVRCDNEVIFLSQDGVYVVNGSFAVDKISGDIEDKILTLAATVAGEASMAAATAFFYQRHYVLCIGTAMYAFNIDTRKWITISVGVTVNAAVVGMPAGSPQLAFMGRSDATGKISLLDMVSTGVATTGMVMRSRLIDPTLPYKERAEMGQQEPRAARKRVKRWKLFGTGTLTSGTIAANIDGRSDSFTLAGADSTQQILAQQEFPVGDTGRAIDFTLSLAGTGIEIFDQLVETVFIG